MPTQAKVAEVEELVRELTGARSVLLADFTGMDVATISDLRRRCRAENVRIRVARNTLSRRALKTAGMEAIEPLLIGPTALAVAHGEELAAARVLMAFAKEKERPRVKGGLIEGKIYSIEELKTLASLPPRKELLSLVLSVFESPLSQLVSGLSQLGSDLMSILDQVAERAGAASPAASTAAATSSPAPADEPAAAPTEAPAGATEAAAEPAAPEAAPEATAPAAEQP